MKPLLLTLAGAVFALTMPGTAQASLSLGPPQSAAVTKAAVAPALRTARFTRLHVERPHVRPRRIVWARGGC